MNNVMDNKTISYYDNNADVFAQSTLNVEFQKVQDKFLKLIPNEGLILDFGCGSGRDAKYFLESGYKVDAVDGSAELCRLASDYAGIDVEQMLFSDLSAVNVYDGIWACSSILHLSKSELRDVIIKMITALKDEAYVYTSFKYGDFEGYRNERYFTDFTEESFSDFIGGIPEIRIVEIWISEDVRPNRGNEKWLNLILQKSRTI